MHQEYDLEWDQLLCLLFGIVWHSDLDVGISTSGFPTWRCRDFAAMARIIYDDRISALDARVVRETAKIFQDSRSRRRFVFENDNMILGNAKSILEIGRHRSSVGHCTTERPDIFGFVLVNTNDQSIQACAEKQAEKQYLSKKGRFRELI
jgi:hypothetical protein